MWASTNGLHHFKEYFPVVSLTAHRKCIFSLKKISLTHLSILGWRLNKWLLGTHCSLPLYKSGLSLDSFISCELALTSSRDFVLCGPDFGAKMENKVLKKKTKREHLFLYSFLLHPSVFSSLAKYVGWIDIDRD